MDEMETAPALPTRRLGQKVDQLGLGEMIIEMLAGDFNVADIVKLCNQELEPTGNKISRTTIQSWLDAQPDKIKKAIAEKQYSLLLAQVWEWERQGIKVREDVKARLETLIPKEEDEIKTLTPSEKKDVANIIMKLMYVQESGERFMGIGTREGKRYKMDINVTVDIIDKIRERAKELHKREAVDAEYTELGEEE